MRIQSWCLVILCSMLLEAEAIADSPPNLNAEAFSAHIQTLAASCAACHGSNGNSVAGTSVLAGLDKNHFVLQMQSFRNGERPSTVMHHHAKGLTLDEIDALGSYFSQQKRHASVMPPSETFEGVGHE